MQLIQLWKKLFVTGSIDDISTDGEIRGWIARRGSDEALNIRISLDEEWETQVIADIMRADVAPHLGNEGKHGFCVALPSRFFDAKTHTVKLYIGDQKTPVLHRRLSADDIQLDGSIDGLSNAGEIRGWVGRKWSAEPIRIRISVDDIWTCSVDCNQFRGDLVKRLGTNGKHAFEVVPQEDLFDGQSHVVKIIVNDESTFLEKEIFFPSRYHQKVGILDSTNIKPVVLDQVTRGMLSGQIRSTEARDGAQIAIWNENGARLCAPLIADEKYQRQQASNICRFAVPLPLSWRQLGQRPVRIELESESTCQSDISVSRGPDQASALIVCDAETPADGSRFYRTELAAEQLRASGLYVKIISAAQLNTAYHEYDPLEYDIVIFQRAPHSESTVRLLKASREGHTLCLYEADDLLFKSWRRNESGVVRSGTVAMNNRNHKEGMDRRLRLMQRCDGVITSTHYLHRELRSLDLTPIISRNCVENEALKFGALRLATFEQGKSNLDMLFMSGTPTHDADFALIEDVLQKILITYPNTNLCLMGSIGPSKLDKFERVIRRPLLPRTQMLSVIAKHDLVLAPMERTGFNTGKSSLKFIESGACGVPIVASDLFEFRRDIHTSGAGRLAESASDWVNQISAFCENPDLSYDQGAKAFSYVAQNYTTAARKDYLWGQIQALHQLCLQDRFDPRTHILRQNLASRQTNKREGLEYT